MKKRDMQKFKKVLMVESDHLMKGIRTIGEDALKSASTESVSDMTSFAEAGTDNNERETSLRLAGSESEMLQGVSDALLRIKDGSYGKCIDCEQDIPVKRMEVFPAAKRCVACKSKFEKEGAF